MAKDTGGPAFPGFVQNQMNGHVVDEMSGMTLRDYFAAKAMQGIAANQRWNVTKQIDNCAREAYAIADAMIKERNKQ